MSAVARIPTSPMSVTSLIASMGMIAVGNGFLFAFIPLKLASAGFAPWVAGAMITAMSLGGVAGCFLTGYLVRRVGHARMFAAYAAVVNLTVLMIALETDATLWLISRVLYGFTVTGLFIVVQSWLNHAAENHWRGKAVAAFYMTYVLGIGLGSYLLSIVSLDGAEGPMLAVFFITMGILPVALTRLETPPPPASISIALRSVWKISPVGLMGMVAVGGLTLLVQGFTPIFAAAENYSQSDIALLMMLMQGGMILVQFPLGALSDKMDRRYVLIVACALISAGAALATTLPGASLVILILVFAIWAGATETIYSVANAHANDRADPEYYVSLSSTMLVVWSVAGFVIPGLATALTPVLGPTAFMYLTVVIALGYAAFVAWRLTRRDAVPLEEQETHQQLSAQAPVSAELAPLPPEEA